MPTHEVDDKSEHFALVLALVSQSRSRCVRTGVRATTRTWVVTTLRMTSEKRDLHVDTTSTRRGRVWLSEDSLRHRQRR